MFQHNSSQNYYHTPIQINPNPTQFISGLTKQIFSFKHAHSHAQTNHGLQHITDYTVNYHITPRSVSYTNKFTLKYTFVVPS